MRKFWQFFRDNPDVEEYILYGGSGGSKSHSTCQYLVELLFTLQDIIILVTRKTRPALKATTWLMIRDVIEADGYVEGTDYILNKSDLEIHANGNIMRFTGLDDPQKLKSSSYNYAYIEEITEFTSDDLFFITNTLRRPRTDGRKNQLFMTFNPVAASHWVWQDKVIARDPVKSAIVHSTHYDNPFLPDSYRQKLEDLVNKNENLYRVYTLGEPGVLEELIYSNYEITRKYDEIDTDTVSYGVDFGYNNPTALIEQKLKDNEPYYRELIYQSHLTNTQLIDLIKQRVPDIRKRFYCDSAEPARIQELRTAGINAMPADKNVIDGINYLKTLRMHIDYYSPNLQKEIRQYSYVKKGDTVLEEPVKFMDHCFVAGTLVRTDQGDRPIEGIQVGDLVLTRAGYRPVIAAFLSGIKPVWEISFSNGTSLNGTHDHPIYVDGKGFVPLDTIRYGDYACSLKPLHSRELNSGDTQTQNEDRIASISNAIGDTSSRASGTYTKSSGSPPMDRFQQAITSTIKMATRLITPLRTLIASLRENICPTIQNSIIRPIKKRSVNTLMKSGLSRRNGMHQRPGGSGIVNTGLKPINPGSLFKKSANAAGNHLMISRGATHPDSAQMPASQNGDEKQESTTLQLSANIADCHLSEINMQNQDFALYHVAVRHIGKLGINLPVYDLTILDQPEFFANGILVHNCMDGCRYVTFSQRSTAQQPFSATQLKRALNPDVKPLRFGFRKG